ncbi:MAG: hypothetical protein NT077_04780 [Candidatus Taylorbacteria bacterium]|nr:hypothetical protein [Candidatus Taylorbacteria bacterium]
MDDYESTIEACIRALSQAPIIIAFDCFESIYSAKDGHVPLPQIGERKIGSHCVCIYKYSREEKCFYFRNSWGKDWGDKGNGTLPFSYFEHGLINEITQGIITPR